MSVDIACVGPVFLDLVFRGLRSLPRPGAELLAEQLVVTPGGMANICYALERLGMSAVVCGPTIRTGWQDRPPEPPPRRLAKADRHS